MYNSIDICKKETDIAFMEMEQDINLRSRLLVINESSGGLSGMIESIIKKIKEIFENIKSRIQQYFTGENYEKSVNDLEKKLRSNPSLKDKKVKARETGKLRSLFRDTVNKIQKAKNVDEIEDAMNNYKKQRDIILGAGGLVVVTGAVLIIMLKRHSKEEIKNLDEDNKRLIEKIEKYKKSGGNDIIDRDAVDDGITAIDEITSQSLKKLTELAREYSRDTLNEIAYNLRVIKEFNNLIDENVV